VVVFDFDGTLTYRDSFLAFLRFVAPPQRLLTGFGRAAPTLVGHMVRLVPNWAAKEAVLEGVLGGMTVADFSAAGERFAAVCLPSFLRPRAAAVIAGHRERGRRLVLVSASLEAYLAPWGVAAGFDDVLATRLETEDGRLTGRLLGRNCYGDEKVVRLRELLGDLKGRIIHAYGDGRGDRQLLELATHRHYRNLEMS
jgi:HAD superfamily hydrolase (TIGR01490 family)